MLAPVCFQKSHHFFISEEIKTTSKSQRTSASMTRTSVGQVRPWKKTRKHHYRPKRINISELRRSKPVSLPPRVIYVTSPFYEQMEYGEKTVEARPNYPSLKDIVPGTVVEFKNRYSGNSFRARITTRRVHHDFASMLRRETIQSCLPDHDPEDLQRAVNTYHSFKQDTYRFIAQKHGESVSEVHRAFDICRTD